MKSELRLKSGNRQYETAALINQSASQSESRLSAEWLLTLICRHSTRKPLLPQWVDNSHTPISIWTAINRRLRIDHARDRGITTEHIHLFYVKTALEFGVIGNDSDSAEQP